MQAIVYILESEVIRRERDLINQQLHNTDTGDNTPLYITKESTKKRKPTDLNSDQK